MRSMTNTNFSSKAGRGGWSRGALTPSAGNDVDFAIKAQVVPSGDSKGNAGRESRFSGVSHRLCYRDTAAINEFTAALQAPS